MSQADLENPGRRTFLKTSGMAAAAGLMTAASAKRVLGANDRIRIAVIGLRGRGWDHVKGYRTIPGVEIAYFCDIDENGVLNPRVADAEKMGLPKPQTYIDVRKLLEDKNVDAVSIATPNHWHSLMGIWAAQAGKDIYIEKPCSHNWWEGRQLVKAVEKYKVICEHGSQCRSSAAILEAMDKMNSGLLGDVYMARGLCYKWRESIGHAPQEPVPPGVHYDLWTGPAPLKPFTKNRFHYNWHWIWDTGNGDLGNQGIHEVDLARWGLGVTLPTKVTAIGGHFLFDDDQQTPNMLTVAYEFKTADAKTKMMNFEVRGWMTNHEAGIGTPEFSGGGVPAAGLAKEASAEGQGVTWSGIGHAFHHWQFVLRQGGLSYDFRLRFVPIVPRRDNEPGPEKQAPVGKRAFLEFRRVRAQPQGGKPACSDTGRPSLLHAGASRQRFLPAWPHHQLRPAERIGDRRFRSHRTAEGHLSRPLYCAGERLGVGFKRARK